MLKRAKVYYQNNKELLRKKAKDKCRQLSDQEKRYKKRVWKK